jgi:hypothetical protein
MFYSEGCCHWGGWQVSLTSCSTPRSRYRVHTHPHGCKDKLEMYCATKDLQVDVTGFSFCDVDDDRQIFFYDFINRATFHLQTFCSTVAP